MSRLLSLALALVGTPASSQTVSAELGGTGAALTVNVEQPLVGDLSARVGLGALPPLGVTVAVPAGLRYAVGDGPLALEVGAGALVAVLSSEYLYTWVTDVGPTPALQVLPTAEAAVRFGLGGSRFARVGVGALYDRYDPSRNVKAVPSLGVGIGV